MEQIVAILMSAMTFVGSWGFSYGYRFDSNCFSHDYLIARELGIHESFVLTLNEDGTAELHRDDAVLYGTWTNEDNLPEYTVSFPEQDLTYTMKYQDEPSVNFDEGCLVLDDWSSGFKSYCLSPVWQCGQCRSFNQQTDAFCPHCGTARP